LKNIDSINLLFQMQSIQLSSVPRFRGFSWNPPFLQMPCQKVLGSLVLDRWCLFCWFFVAWAPAFEYAGPLGQATRRFSSGLIFPIFNLLQLSISLTWAIAKGTSLATWLWGLLLRDWFFFDCSMVILHLLVTRCPASGHK
jgi:hypothetical protein